MSTEKFPFRGVTGELSGEVKQCERGDKDLLKDKNSRRSVRSAPDADELSLGEFLERPYPGWGETYGNKCGWYSIVCQIIGKLLF